MQFNILVVQQEDPAGCALFQDVMRRDGAIIVWERDLRRAKAALAATSFDLVVTEPDLPDGSGLTLIEDRAGQPRRWATVVLMERGDVCGAVAAIRQGAFEVIERPGRVHQLIDIVERISAQNCLRDLDKSAITVPSFASTGQVLSARSQGRGAIDGLDPIIGQSSQILRLRQQVSRIAPVPTDVFLYGETGSGKDLVARQIHALSGRPGPMVALNCGAIPDALFESELFGHETGAFTGASKSQMGKIEQAHLGTLFLDEIESMPIHQQVKLLRVLETRRVTRVGGRGETAVDFRVVAAAQERLDERCRSGLFRSDLWHRLNVVTLSIPALRHRRDDVVPLFQHCVAQACQRFGVELASVPAFDGARLAAHDWPGNVRELVHAAERHVLGLPVLPGEHDEGPCVQGLAEHLGRCERELIRTALDRHGRRMRAVAEELGISEKTLMRRIAVHQLGSGSAARSHRASQPR